MAKLKKYDINGKETGDLELSQDLLDGEFSSQMVKDYLDALRKNQRQWSANTKGRSEISYSKKKPHPQKGTGNARQGFLGSPQYRGGGIVFGPKPKFDQHVRINQKERRAAIRSLLIERINDDKVCVLESVDLKQPKTKAFAKWLASTGKEASRCLFLGSGHESEAVFSKSMRNLPKVSFKRLQGVNGYDLALCKHIIIMEPAFNELEALLGGKRS